MDTNPDGPQDSAGDGGSSLDRGPNKVGIAAALAGVVAFVLFFSFTRGLGLAVAIGAIVLGFVARSHARSNHLRTRMANVGIICGLLLGAFYPILLYLESIWPP